MKEHGTRLGGVGLEYKSFYHLHAPKTGGRFVLNNVLHLLYPHMEAAGIRVINNVPIEHPDAHGAWSTEIKEDTYVFSTFRDPVTHTCSLFFHMVALDQGPQFFPNPPTFTAKLLNPRYLINFMTAGGFNGHQMTNFQSKNFLYERHFYGGPLDFSINPEVQGDLLMQRLRRTNLLLRMEQIPQNPVILATKLIEDMELPLSVEQFKEEYLAKSDYLTVLNPLLIVKENADLARSLTEEDLDIIRPYIAIDQGIYSDNSVFYTFDQEN